MARKSVVNILFVAAVLIVDLLFARHFEMPGTYFAYGYMFTCLIAGFISECIIQPQVMKRARFCQIIGGLVMIGWGMHALPDDWGNMGFWMIGINLAAVMAYYRDYSHIFTKDDYFEWLLWNGWLYLLYYLTITKQYGFNHLSFFILVAVILVYYLGVATETLFLRTASFFLTVVFLFHPILFHFDGLWQIILLVGSICSFLWWLHEHGLPDNLALKVKEGK